MHYVYILYSEKLNRFYIGETHDLELRIEKHNNGYYDNKWTAAGKPWVLYYAIECNCKPQALEIERHIKQMKSRVYIEHLKKYPELLEKLKDKYKVSC